jgi:hypothetical protein
MVASMELVIIGLFGVFALVLVVIAASWANSTLSKLPLEAGEEVLFELSRVMVRLDASHPTNFPGGVIRVTNRRIIVAQKMLMSKDAVLRYVVRYRSSPDVVAAGETARKGYIALSVDKLTIENKAGTPTLLIPLVGSVIIGTQTVEIPLENPDRWRQAGIVSDETAS